jgi:hypothetical protein
MPGNYERAEYSGFEQWATMNNWLYLAMVYQDDNSRNDEWITPGGKRLVVISTIDSDGLQDRIIEFKTVPEE